MNKTKIEWVINADGSPGYTWNPIVGCKFDCDYCYAKTLNDRFTFVEDWTNPETVDARKSIKQLEGFRDPKTIFVGSMSDLFGYWVEAGYIKSILSVCAAASHKHTFLFLTKNPVRYLDTKINPCMDWEYAFPNMWRGTTVTNKADFSRIDTIRSFGRNFVSCEPVLGSMADINLDGIKWLIIGTLNKDGKPVPEDKGGTKEADIISLIESTAERPIQIFIKDEVFNAFPALKDNFNILAFRQLPYLPEGISAGGDPGEDDAPDDFSKDADPGPDKKRSERPKTAGKKKPSGRPQDAGLE